MIPLNLVKLFLISDLTMSHTNFLNPLRVYALPASNLHLK